MTTPKQELVAAVRPGFRARSGEACGAGRLHRAGTESSARREARDAFGGAWSHKRLRCVALAVALALPLGAAAFWDSVRDGARTDCMKRNSFAWCVLDAADMSHKLVDIRRGTLDAALKESGLGVVDIAFMAGSASGLIAPPKFGAGWMDISMSLLGAITEKKPAVLGYNKVIAWMPFEMAATADEADELLINMVHRATRDVFKAYEWQEATIPPFPGRPRRLGTEDQFGWLLTGPDCPPGACRLWNNLGRNARPEPPLEGKAPEWLGGYKAWVFAFRSGPSMHEFWTGKAYESIRYASALSKLLPEWAYLQMTPEYAISIGWLAKPLLMNPGLRMPLVMNKGRTWLPVFPELDVNEQGGGK